VRSPHPPGAAASLGLDLLCCLPALLLLLRRIFDRKFSLRPIWSAVPLAFLGAWMMLVFGTTGAPIIEELAFRGFLLPGILNLFRARASEATVQTVGIPVSILLASIPFVLLHAAQVSKAWGPLLLIGLVSIVLCIVRLALKSVAAGVVVHAAYNFSLFAGVLAQTDGFRHLEKLTS